jgi:hypothetical protein
VGKQAAETVTKKNLFTNADAALQSVNNLRTAISDY